MSAIVIATACMITLSGYQQDRPVMVRIDEIAYLQRFSDENGGDGPYTEINFRNPEITTLQVKEDPEDIRKAMRWCP